ncbi:MAG TPA: nicotinate-nucleotide adenylyltransferase [Solirubrobacteraceae bacterium]
MRLGILGGTFNPPHLGHLVCAQEAHGALSLDRVVLVPALVPPHKAVDDDPGIEHRLELCRRAVAGDDRLEVCSLEAERPGTSYTVDTLEELKTRSPDTELYMLLGADVAAGLPRWREPERVLSLARLAIAARPGTSRGAVTEALAGLGGGDDAQFFAMPTIGVSSTMIRRRVRAGQPIKYLVPDEVERYIEARRLYRSSVVK